MKNLMENLKRGILATIIGLLLMSCEPEKGCGKITGYSYKMYSGYNEYYLHIDNNPIKVDVHTWYSHHLGEYVCLE